MSVGGGVGGGGGVVGGMEGSEGCHGGGGAWWGRSLNWDRRHLPMNRTVRGNDQNIVLDDFVTIYNI